MTPTNQYVLEFMTAYARSHPGARILDFGCGAGALVAAGRARGLDLQGADVYYGGSRTRAEAQAAGLLGSVVHEIHNGRMPFPDASFDLVTNNQVMEHVTDLDAVLGEIHRVLRPKGAVLSIFPSRGVFREGHIGIPFAHWFPRDSRARFYYTWALRRLGMGTWKEQAPTPRQWALDKLAWIDAYTCYRTKRAIMRAYARYFSSAPGEPDYIRFRLRRKPQLARCEWMLGLPLGSAAATILLRRLGFMVILSTR